MVFTTQRCLIRPFTDADIDSFMAYRNDEGWMRFQGFKGLSREAYARALLAPQTETEGVQLAIVDQAQNRLIGDLYLKQMDDAAEIGYTVAPQFARQGYAREAVLGLLQQLGVSRRTVRAAVMPDNAPSLALLQSLGFQKTGVDAEGDWLFETTVGR